MNTLAIGTWPLPEHPRTVRVTVPAAVAFDRDRMRKVTELVLGRLGHPQCHSGWDIRFDVERRFAFDEKLSLHAMFEGGGVIING